MLVCSSAKRLFLRCPLLCREKLVKVAVELLSTEVAEKGLVVVMLRLLAMLMAKYDWRVQFASLVCELCWPACSSTPPLPWCSRLVWW